MSRVWLFPGQGSQAVGMGRELHDASPRARAVFEEAERVCDRIIRRGNPAYVKFV